MTDIITVCDKHGNLYTIPTDEDTVTIGGIRYVIIRTDIIEPLRIGDKIVGQATLEPIFLSDGNYLIETYKHTIKLPKVSKKHLAVLHEGRPYNTNLFQWIKNLFKSND